MQGKNRRRARLVLLFLLALALVADPLSHNHLVNVSSSAFSIERGSSLQHPICPVCAMGGSHAILEQVAAPFILQSTFFESPEPLVSEGAGETLHRPSRAPPAFLI